jgi:DNA-binding transcriptional LysR family regulator
MPASISYNLRHLRVFQAVAHHHSVSRASLLTGVSQPAATQAIAKLESIFEVPLFQRSHSGCYPTEFGAILLTRVERHFAQIDQAIADVQANAVRARTIASKVTSTHVRCMVKIAEHGSIEPAAGVLGISVAALSRAARNLEKIIGRELFHRGPQGTTLSRTGAEIARRFELAIREVKLAAEEIATAKGQSTASILIGALPLFPKQLIMASLSDLSTEYPNVKVKFVEGAYLSLLSDLRSGRLDYLFSVMRLPEWVDDVREEELFRATYAVVGRQGHPLARSKSVTLADLARFPWVLPQPGTPRRAAFDQLFEGFASSPPTAVETHSLDFQRCFIAGTDSLSLVTMQEAAAEQFAILPFQTPIERRADGVAVRADWRPTTVQAAFLDSIHRNAKRGFPIEPRLVRSRPDAHATDDTDSAATSYAMPHPFGATSTPLGRQMNERASPRIRTPGELAGPLTSRSFARRLKVHRAMPDKT